MKLIQLVSTVTNCKSVDFNNKTVVIIDVLRATSVITTALFHGAKAILPVTSISEALDEFKKYKPDEVLLCGERDAKRIDGFNLGNSPLEYTPEYVKDKVIILSTSNGTAAINVANNAKELLIASFLNISHLAKYLSDKTDDLIIVCSGTNGEFSMEDGLCAGMLISLLSRNHEIVTDDLAFVLKEFYESNGKDIIIKLKHCKHLNYLIANGFENDVAFCLQTDKMEIIPKLSGKFIIAG